MCRDDEDRIQFAGWARMALPLVDFTIIEVKHPNVGEVKPAGVTADVVFTCEGAIQAACCSERSLM